MNCNIILCGFMGSGKSTVGLLLAKKLGMSFIDLDTYIEKKEGMTVSKIFEKYGEPYFRKVEKESAKELAEKNGLVIAAGGGTLVDKENAEDVVDPAMLAGAKGGTIINARGSGIHETSKIFSIEIDR